MYLAKAANFPAKLLARAPFRFGLCRLLGRQDLRCVLFHHVSDSPCQFSNRLGVSITPKQFESVIRFLATHYTPVSLDEVLSSYSVARFPERPILVTFDDAYASIATVAAEICHKYKVPGVFFVNAKFVGNHELALDNLLCYIANKFSMTPINNAAKSVCSSASEVFDLKDVFAKFLPALSLYERKQFEDELIVATGVNARALAAEAQLYVNEVQLQTLANSGIEIGNHTYSHVNCRVLKGPDFESEISCNKSELEKITGQKIKAFSVPYGSRHDLTPALSQFLKSTGHEAVFLVESAANTKDTRLSHLSRVSISADRVSDVFSDVEVLPRLRSLRNGWLRRHTAENDLTVSRSQTAV